MNSSAESVPPAPGKRSRTMGCLRGCALWVVLPLAVLVTGLFAWRMIANARAAALLRGQGDAAATSVQAGASPDYSIDETMRAMNELDRLLQVGAPDFLSYLQHMANSEYRNMAPEMAAARAELIRELTAQYSIVANEADREAVFQEYRGGMDALFSSAGMSAFGGFTFDPTAFREHMRQAQAIRRERQVSNERVRNARLKFIDALTEYMKTYYRFRGEWDAFCRLRDQAYFQIAEGDWKGALAASDAALAKSPRDREARLLRAWALAKQVETPATELRAEAARLEELLAENPELEGAILLAQALMHERLGDDAKAEDLLNMAKTRFPKQIANFHQLADLYTMRDYLKKSPEGVAVLRQFEALVTGSGTFNPELQAIGTNSADGVLRVENSAAIPSEMLGQIRVKLQQHQANQAALQEARTSLANVGAKVMSEHGAVRSMWLRVWDAPAYARMTRAAALPLEIRIAELEGLNLLSAIHSDVMALSASRAAAMQVTDPAQARVTYAVTAGSAKAKLVLLNARAAALTNATVVLLVRYTDAQPGDFEYRMLPQTLPKIEAQSTTELGEVDFAHTSDGTPKGAADIVEMFALIVSDEELLVVGAGQ